MNSNRKLKDKYVDTVKRIMLYNEGMLPEGRLQTNNSWIGIGFRGKTICLYYNKPSSVCWTISQDSGISLDNTYIKNLLAPTEDELCYLRLILTDQAVDDYINGLAAMEEYIYE